jgi:predicted DNA-binding transcriptional regulator AlpA
MGTKVDLDDLINAAKVAEMIGLAQRNSVSTYRRRHADFPAPVIEDGRCVMWRRSDIKRWMRSRTRQ